MASTTVRRRQRDDRARPERDVDADLRGRDRQLREART